MKFGKLYIFGFLVFIFSLRAFDQDDQERVRQIQDVIKEGSRYKLQAVELFDGETPWSISRSTSFLESVRFIAKAPNAVSYKLESDLYYKLDSTRKRKSMQVHSNIEIPGRDKWFIVPELRKPLAVGTPVRVFFWVYSNNYDINLKIVFSQRKSQDVVVDFGLLKFNGWRRLDSRIITNKTIDRLNLSREDQFELKGILLESSTFQSKGSFYIFLDQMGVLIENSQTYPGSEVPDGWELY